MDRPRGLDDPDHAAFAWARYRRILGWMALAALVTAGAAELALYWSMGELRLVTAITTLVGVFLTMLLAAVLMGLMFLSSGTGHDAQVEDRLKEEIDLD